MSIKYYDKSGATPEEKLLAGVSPVDAILNGTSKNAIQNKAVYNALKDKLEAATTALINYYLKTDVYNKSEVRALIGAVETLTMEVVSSLPVSDISTTTIYLLKPTGSNVYDEYVYISDAWVKIGTTDMDLSGYMLTADFNVAIADYFTKTEINNLLNSYYTKAEIDADFYDKDAVDDLIADVSSDIDDTATDIYEVMGKNGAKNLLPNITVSKTISGITYTRNSNGSVTINGTSTGWGQNDVGKCLLPKGTYTISVGVTVPSGVFFTLRDDDADSSILNLGNGGTETKRDFTLASDTNIRLYCGISGNVTVSNITFYPMVRLASDTDTTYQPYAETNYQLTQDKMSYVDNGILGAKNLIPYSYSDTTKTANGVTFTDLGDGTVKVNGTATATALFTLAGLNKQVLKAGTYILSGCPDVSAGAYIQVYANGSGTTIAKDRYENEPGGVRFTLTQEQVDANNIMIGIAVLKDTQVSNAIFKPMIRLASDTDATYQPYAMTNSQITNDLKEERTKNGVVNILDNTMTTKTLQSVTLTVNSDKTITTSGTSTGLIAESTGVISGISGTYRVSGCPSGGSASTYCLQLLEGSTYLNAYDTGSGVEYTFDGTKTYYVMLVIRASQNVTGKTFKPMVAPTWYDGEYLTYAMTNRELTEKVSIELTKSDQSSSLNQNSSFVCGRLVEFNFNVSNITLTANSWKTIVTFPVKHAPSALLQFPCIIDDNNGNNMALALLRVTTAGRIEVRPNSATQTCVRVGITYVR